MSSDPKESRARAISQVAELFPYLSPAERFDWWDRLGCKLTELTVHMPTFGERLEAAQQERLDVHESEGP